MERARAAKRTKIDAKKAARRQEDTERGEFYIKILRGRYDSHESYLPCLEPSISRQPRLMTGV